SHALHQLDGNLFVFFVMVVAAAEAAVGLAIIISVVRNRRTSKWMPPLSCTNGRRLAANSLKRWHKRTRTWWCGRRQSPMRPRESPENEVGRALNGLIATQKESVH